MPAEHTELMEILQAYLLDELPEHRAEAVEREYFHNRALLGRVREAEARLIEDYLDRRLSNVRMTRFEERCQSVPGLRDQVEAAREARGSAPAQRRREAVWRYAPALAILLLMASSLVWYSQRPATPQPMVVTKTVPPSAPAVVVALSPGVVMGSQAGAAFTVPPPGAVVRLELELPGLRQPMDYSVRIFEIQADGGRRLAWTNKAVVSPVVTSEGESLDVDVESGAFAGGDYVVEAAGADGHVRETYLVRANRVR
jgi:hypothetical protein